MDERTPTPAQVRAVKLCGINGANARWHGPVIVAPYPEAGGDGDLYALVSEHGSVTVCPVSMLDAHLAGIRA